MINKYPFNDDLFWPILANTVNRFVTSTVEQQGPILLDRVITGADIAFMKGLNLNDMELVVSDPDSSGFVIKHKKQDEGMVFSNRVSSRGEMRGEILRTALLRRKESPFKPDLTLYEALDDIYRGDITESDLLIGFLTPMSYDSDIGEYIPSDRQQLIKNVAKEMVRYKKANPPATEEEIIAHGQGFIPPNPSATDHEIPEQGQGFIPPNPEKKSNSVAKLFGFFLIALGITIAFAPIPGLAQILGTWLTAMGLGVSVGTFTLGLGLAAAAIGLGIFGFAFRSNQKSHISQESQEATLLSAQHEADSAVGSSPDNSLGANSSQDLQGFEDNAAIVSEISRANSNLSEQAQQLVNSVSTDSGAPIAVANKLAASDDTFEEDRTPRSNY